MPCFLVKGTMQCYHITFSEKPVQRHKMHTVTGDRIGIVSKDFHFKTLQNIYHRLSYFARSYNACGFPRKIKAHKAVYFGAVGGAGALLAKCITSQKVLAWPELGPEALRELKVEEMPLIVVIDTEGHDLYKDH